MGIAFNTHTWVFMLGNGLAAAASTRVSNALGAGHPDEAKLSAEARCLALSS
jgi:MATE family multidrug resistance protein